MNRFILLIITQLLAILSFAKSNSEYFLQDEAQLVNLPQIDDNFFSSDSRSVEELKQAVSKNPKDANSIIKLCYQLKKIGKHSQANEYAVQGIENNIENNTLLNIAGAALIHTHETDKLYEICLKAIAKNPKNADAYNLMGIIAHKTGNPYAAVKHFEKALSIKKKKYNCIKFNLANSYRALEKYDEAVELYQKASKKKFGKNDFVSIRNFHFRKPSMLWINNNIGLTYTMKGDYSNAMKAYREALRIKNNSSRVFNGMACTYFEMGLMDSCEIMLNKAIVNNPKFSAPYKNLGNLYYERGKEKVALEYFDKAYKLDNTDEWLIIRTGCCYKKMNQWKKAIEVFDEALRINQFNGETHFLKGVCYYLSGDIKNANEAFNLALKNGYEQARGWIRTFIEPNLKENSK